MANARTKRFSPLSTSSATRQVLERHGLYTKYTLGQNFLVNDDVLGKILDLANIQPTDAVLEVGPGIGTLTAALLQHAGCVVAVEKDEELSAVLADTLAPWTERFTLLLQDALDVKPADIAFSRKPFKMVSNLPYAVAATVVLDYFQRFENMTSATVMVQKEVADRIAARPSTKEYGAYTVKLSLYAKPSGRFSVAPGNFFPPPHVESSVMRLDCCMAQFEGRQLSCLELDAVCRMADAAFATRRKTLANSCKVYFANSPRVQAALPLLFERVGIDPRRRGETLDRDEFIELGLALLDFEDGIANLL